MVLISYNVAVPSDPKSKDFITIVLENGKEYTGEFSDLRIQRETIPEGKYAYDLRDVDCEGNVRQVLYFARVNHFGTIITDTPIDNIEDGPIVTDWWFEYNESN